MCHNLGIPAASVCAGLDRSITGCIASANSFTAREAHIRPIAVNVVALFARRWEEVNFESINLFVLAFSVAKGSLETIPTFMGKGNDEIIGGRSTPSAIACLKDSAPD